MDFTATDEKIIVVCQVKMAREKQLINYSSLTSGVIFLAHTQPARLEYYSLSGFFFFLPSVKF